MAGSRRSRINRPATAQVIEWNDRSNNLKVGVAPGPNVTQAAFFTFGSHKDDVIRIQGTPTSVVVYSALGEEVWRYGFSSVTFDTNTNQVIEWNDLSNNLKVGGK